MNMPTFSSSTTILIGVPIEEAADRLAGCGFAEIEIFDGAQTDDWLDDPARTEAALRTAGLRVRTVHLPVIGWEIDSPDESLRLIALQACSRAMTLAAGLGAETAICHPNGAHLAFYASNYGDSWQRTRNSLEWLAARAGEIGIKLALENLPAHFTRRPGMYVSELLCMIEGLGEHVGICIDAGHSTANGISAAVEVRTAGAKLFALHIQDNDGSGADQHLLPGKGVTDWAGFRQALRDAQFSGAYTFEVGRGACRNDTLQQLAALRQEWSQD
jgi:sugar phosphate isomerase/epimerase